MELSRWSSNAIGRIVVTCLVTTWAIALNGCRFLPYSRRSAGDLVSSRQFTQRGLSDLRSGRSTDAEKHFSDAVRTCPLDPMARKLYADALWKRGAQGEAIEQMHECIRLAGALDVAQVVRLGDMYLQRGDLVRAEEQALEAIRIASDDSSAWVLRARVQRKRGKLEVALADFHRALSHDPDNLEVRLEVAELYNTIHRPERGLAILHALTEQLPEQEQSPRVALLEGLALQQLGRHYEAIEAFARAQQSGAPPGDVFLHSADSYLAMGLPDRARWAVGEAERSSAPSAAVQEARTRIAAVRMDPAVTVQR